MKSQMDLWIGEAIEYVYDYYLFDDTIEIQSCENTFWFDTNQNDDQISKAYIIIDADKKIMSAMMEVKVGKMYDVFESPTFNSIRKMMSDFECIFNLEMHFVNK